MSKNSKCKRDAKKKKAKKIQNRLKSNVKNTNDPVFSGPVITTMDHPFSNIPVEKRKELISDIGKRGKEKFIELLGYFNSIFREYDPHSIIATLSNYGLTVGAGDAGV